MKYFIQYVNVASGSGRADKAAYDYCRQYLQCIIDSNCIDQLEEAIMASVVEFHESHPRTKMLTVSHSNYGEGTEFIHCGECTLTLVPIKKELFV